MTPAHLTSLAYTKAGVNKIAQKVGEEATEVVIAAKDAAADAEQKPALVSEVADLWFHSLCCSVIWISAQMTYYKN